MDSIWRPWIRGSFNRFSRCQRICLNYSIGFLWVPIDFHFCCWFHIWDFDGVWKIPMDCNELHSCSMDSIRFKCLQRIHMISIDCISFWRIWIGSNGFPWIPPDFIRFPWFPMGFEGFQQISMDSNGFPWIPTDFGCFQVISIYFKGFQLISIDFTRFPRIWPSQKHRLR